MNAIVRWSYKVIMMARELPIYQIKGRKYFRDERLGEYRATDDPNVRIPFDKFHREGMELEKPTIELTLKQRVEKLGEMRLPGGTVRELAAKREQEEKEWRERSRTKTPPIVRNLLKIREDPDNCREFFKDLDTGEVFITAEGEFHEVSDEGEPFVHVEDLRGINIIPQACAEIFIRRASRRTRPRRS